MGTGDAHLRAETLRYELTIQAANWLLMPHCLEAENTASSTALRRDLLVLAWRELADLLQLRGALRPLGLLDLILQKLPIVFQRLQKHSVQTTRNLQNL